MTLDLYSLCPSGNGKKIKFCKCQDSLAELDRVMTMLGGGQVVPALDRLNRMLSEHPDAACALAIKGRVLLDLREYDLLAENAERFIRLQPNNPLALTQRAAAQVFRGQIPEATESLLQALAESGMKVDSFVLEIASVLSYMLSQRGEFLPARAFATLALSAEGFEGASSAAGILQELNTSPAVNHLLKALPASRPRPERTEWAERFDEALGLLRSHRISLANTKFASLARSYANEPAILSGLLTCAIWRADSATQVDCLKKLSRCEKLDRVERSKFLAMAWLTEPQLKEMSVDMMSMTADIEHLIEAEVSLQASPYFSAVPNNTLRQLVSKEDEVPPRSGFQLLDQAMPENDAALTGENLPETIALVLVFGKQTDRAARIEIKSILPMFLDVVRRTLAETLAHARWEETVAYPVPFVMASDPRPAWSDRPAFRTDLGAVLADFRKSRYSHRIAMQPIPALHNRSLKDAAADPSLALEREALVRVLENTDSLATDTEVINEIRTLAGVEPLPSIHIKTAEELENVENSDLARVDCVSLDNEGLGFLLRRGQLLQMDSVLRQASLEVLNRGDQVTDGELRGSAYMALVESSESPVDALRWIGEAKPYFEKAGLDMANLLLVELSTRARANDIEGFQGVIRKLTTDYRNREDVMAVLQQMLVSMGLLNPDGSPRRQAARPSGIAGGDGDTGGIWTPDSASPASPGPIGAPTSPAAGKLWIPGMD